MMDHIKDLSAFQGVILSVDNYYSFSKLTSKGGNEEKVKYVLEKLSKFLQEKKYITENGIVEENIDDYRKLALYLILNSDLPVLEEMTEMEGLESVVWMLPTVPTFLLCELLWGLRMERFLGEAVVFCRPRLALQLAAAAAAHLRYLDPVTQLPRARRVAAALYRALLRLHFAARADAALLAAALGAFRACLRCFVAPPNAERVLRLSRDDQYRHLGRSLALVLDLLQECLGHFNGRQEFEAEGFADVYRATHLPEEIETESLDFDICDSPNEAILQCLIECNASLLDDCAALVMNVSVDIFCAWSEYEEDGKSMQQSIGELCFRVRQTLAATAGAAEHALAGMLRQLAREPPRAGAGALAAAAPELLARASGAGAEPRAWRAALLRRADLARQPALLQLLESHLAEFDEEQCFQLFKIIIDHLKEDRENSEYLKSFAVKVFHRCDADAKRAIVREQFKDRFHDDMESADFNDTLTDIFNRLTASNGGDPTDVLAAFLQNPRRVFMKIFKSAAENAQQADMMLEVMIGLKEFCDKYYDREAEPCVIEVSHHAFDNFLDTEMKEEHFVKFMCGLKTSDVIPGDELLLLVAMPGAARALRARDVRGMRARTRLLAAGWGAAGLRPRRAPALALLAQLADALRWPPRAFRADLPPALDRVLALLRELLATYGDRVPEPERAWLRPRVERLHPLNRLYFHRVLGAELPPASTLLQALGSLTAREWQFPLRAAWGARGTEARAAPARQLRRLARAAPACLDHALANYVAHLHRNYFDEPPTEEQLAAALREAARVAAAAGAAGARLAGALAPLAAACGARAPAAAAAALAPAPRLAAALAPLLRAPTRATDGNIFEEPNQ